MVVIDLTYRKVMLLKLLLLKKLVTWWLQWLSILVLSNFFRKWLIPIVRQLWKSEILIIYCDRNSLIIWCIALLIYENFVLTYWYSLTITTLIYLAMLWAIFRDNARKFRWVLLWHLCSTTRSELWQARYKMSQSNQKICVKTIFGCFYCNHILEFLIFPQL